jgi:hypothetical protein
MSLTKVKNQMIDGAAVNPQDFGASPTNTAGQNDTAFAAAMAAMSDGDTMLIQDIYAVNTINITKRIDIRGINSGGNGLGTNGSGFSSTSNAPILNYSTTASRFASLEDITFLGDLTAGTSQNAILINNLGMRINRISIRNMGGSGILVTNSYSGSYRNIYTSFSNSSGIKINGGAGANLWDTVTSVASGQSGFELAVMDGADVFINCGPEQNTHYGILIGAGVKGNNFIGTYSELNGLGTIIFAAGSDDNSVHFNAYSSSVSEPDPVNNGGTGNTVSGKKYLTALKYRMGGYTGIGDVGIYPSYMLDVAETRASNYVAHTNNKSATGPNNLFLELSGVTGGGGATFLDAWDNSRRFVVFGNGNVANVTGSYATFSDIKLKENITDATPKLSDLLSVRVVNYNLIENPEEKLLGVIAQELEAIFPGLVTEHDDYNVVTSLNDDGEEVIERVLTGTKTKSVKYSVFVLMLIKAMQEQQALITDMQSRLSALEAL